MDRSRAFEAALVVGAIMLAALLYFAIVSTPQAVAGWETELNGNVDYMFVGSDDTLYTFSGNTVSAMSKDSNFLWQYIVPAEWRVLNDWEMLIYSSGHDGIGKSYRSYPIVAESNGSLYLFAMQQLNWTDAEAARNVSEKTIGTGFHYSSPDIPYISKPALLMKISPDGTVAWNYSFLTNVSTWNIGGLVSLDFHTMEKPIAVSVLTDRVYLFHDYTEDVLDADGRQLFSIRNVSAPAAVDTLGNIYSVRALKPTQEQFNQSMMANIPPDQDDKITVGGDYMKISRDMTYMLTSSIIEAYSADGTLLWTCDTGRNATRPYIERDVWSYYNTLPLLSNNQLYAPAEDGIIAVGLDGRIRWNASIGDGVYTYLSVMPVDSHGNIYMMKLDAQWLSHVVMIASDGQVSDNTWPCYAWPYYEHQISYSHDPVIAGGKDGIAYAFMSSGGTSGNSHGEFEEMLSSKRFNADTICAYDLASGGEVWNFTIPMADKHVITLNERNVNEVFPNPRPFRDGSATNLAPDTIFPEGIIEVYPGKDVLYLSYYYAMAESPLIANKSRCIYARGFYALDNNGKLLWDIQLNDNVDQVAVGNNTVYYRLDNGRIGGSSLGIAAGAVLTAFAYMFLRFFMVGTVARAKGRIERNENRNVVLQYVIDHPGVTAADISKDIDMNMGTLRYHLFVLTMNHKIATHKDSGKFMRYFKNSGAYTQAEKDLLSLVRRRPLQKILFVLIERPERSCSDLAGELGISVTAVSRHVTELADKGIVEKQPSAERGFVYSVRREHRDMIVEQLRNY